MSASKGNARKTLASTGFWNCHATIIRCLLLLTLGCFSGGVLAQPKPAWVTPQSINSDDGYGALRWTVDGDKPIALFRITEEFEGQQAISFTDQAELRIFRIDSGTYTFKVQACERGRDGYPKCGNTSSNLTFNVSKKIDKPSARRTQDGVESPQASAVINVSGGPDQLRPGLWYNPARSGHGWSFYWANRLALPESHAQYGYEYDLMGVWYTYEAKHRYQDGPPPCGEGGGGTGCFWSYENYAPLVADLKLVRTATNTYSGGIYITRSGVEYHQGTVTVIFGSANTSATINWNAKFKWQSLSGSDSITPLAAATSNTNAVGLYAGIWALPGNAGIRIVDDIGAVSEAVEVSFFDSAGDPGWIQAVSSATPSTAETPLCFYYVQSGYPPNASGTLSFHQSGCDPNQPASASNRNGSRAFTGFEQGKLWVAYTLSSTLGAVRIGTSTSPASMEKRANFHRIYWSSANGTACQLTASTPSCALVLTWFTDGDYPQASVFRVNQSTGQREFVATSTGPAVTGYSTSLNQAGSYVFELRMTTSANSALLAVSSPYTVTSAAIAMPVNLGVAWIDQSSRKFRVTWSHPSPSSVSFYQLEETHPGGGGSVTHTVSPSSVFEKSFDYRNGPYGSYTYRLRACSGTAGSAQCSAWTGPVPWQVETNQAAAHPWSSQVQGTLVSNAGYQYAMGYHFLPEVNGTITELGGLFNGVKRIKLFERVTGRLLAETTVSANNQWAFAPIAPVVVTAGTEYTVAVYLAGTGGSYYQSAGLPVTRQGIRILGSTYVSTASNADERPTNLVTSTMYGQADIGFVAGAAPPPANVPPMFASEPGPQSGFEGDSIRLQIRATDADGDKLTYSHGGTLPPGLSLTSAGLIQGSLATGASANSPYPVVITVSDGIAGHDISTLFSWTVLAAASSANPEVPPAPAPMPSLAIDTTSSRVGATPGEFQVTDTGGARYSVPIRTTPGSGGFVPSVSVSWSSQNGNGPLGVGGALEGISAITRCAQTFEQDGAGYQGGITLTKSDRFCLDGQRLMAISGEYGTNGTEYRTEIDSFTRIISYGTAGNGPASFKAWYKDGTLIEFGATQDSRIEARSLTDSQTVLTWAQNRLSDPAGNYADYVYSELSGGAGDPVDSVLQSISYTGNSRAGTSPYAQIDFIYSNQRADATIAYTAGAATRQGRLLQRIDSRSRVSSGSNLVFLRSYHLAYGSDAFGNAILQSITECNDSAKSHCFPPTAFGWQLSKHEVGTSSVGVGSVFNSQHRALTMADITGDGLPDLLLTERSGSSYRFRIAPALSTGSFGNPGSTVYSIPNNGTADVPTSLHTIDLNADGFQDVIYATAAGWKGRLSTGSGLGSELALSGTCCGLSSPPLVRIMDFDGDGLSDLVTSRAAASNQQEIVLLRNRFSPSNSADVGFEPPRLLTFSVSAQLFPEKASGGWALDTDTPHFEENPSPGAPFSRPFDYNGDGAVDLLVKLSRRYVQCGRSCTSKLDGPASGQRVAHTRFQLAGDTSVEESPQATSVSYAWASFYLVMTSDGTGGFEEHDVIGTGIDCTVSDACGPYAALPRIRRALPVDINLDGLADMAFLDNLYDWKARLNSGAGFKSQDIPIADFNDASLAPFVRFQDLNGDGYPEFVYPNQIEKDTAVWVSHENRFGASFASAAVTDDPAGNTGQADASIMVDVNGDGMLDNLFVDVSSLGAIVPASTKVFLGKNTLAGQPAQAINAVNSITDGLGANTSIQYLPLTDTGAYTRTRNSKNASWGNNSAVFDFVAPIHVVSQVQSSSPVFGNPSARSRVEYHYVGAKLQGGGRGFLGFAEVVSWDAQTGIRTNTRFRQDFPFTGRLADTTRAIATASRKFDTVTSSTATTPVSWSAVTATTVVPPVGSGGNILSHLVNQWASAATTTNPRVTFPYIVNELERAYTLQGKVERKTLTTNTWDSYGNPLTVVNRTYAADDSSAVATTTTRNTFNVDAASWRLNRLMLTSMTRSRSGVPDIVRETSFDYDPSTGLLIQQTEDPNLAAFRVTTGYKLDNFGNRTTVTVTGNGMAARISTQAFDPLGRFAIQSRNAFSQLTRNVISWDAHGNATAIEDIEGTRQVSAADHMGRVFITADATGARSKTIFRSGAGSACPAGDTAYHTYTTQGGKPDKYRCLDVLGREIRNATQGFDGRLINIDRYWDSAGRLERISEPYFAGETRYWNLTAYDGKGRVDAVLAADGNDQTFDYDDAAAGCGTSGPRRTRITNGLGQTRIEVLNVLGETVSVYDHLCGVVSYTYDAAGNLTRISGADGAVTTMTYDVAGRKTSLADPDKGRWLYAYNALGELLRQVDGKSQALDFAYDVMGRIVERRELTGVSSLTDSTFTTLNRETATFNNSTSATVRGKGQLSRVVYRSGESGAILHQKDYGYDTFGRVSSVSSTLDGFQSLEETTYDEFGRVFQQFDASGDDRGIRYHYNARGYPEKLQEAREGKGGKVYQQVKAMDARGNATYMVLGNGVETFASFAPASGRLQVLEAYDKAGVELQFVKYGFDVLGNLTSRHDTSGSGNLREDFGYDALNRLEAVLMSTNGGTARTTLSLQYGAGGNITYKSDVGSYVYGQNGAGQHAVTKAGTVTFTYDANGNQISSSNGRSITYSIFDQALRVQNASGYTEFGYGIGNQLVKRTDNNPVDGNRSIWYLGSTERFQVANGNPRFKRYLGAFAIADVQPATGAQTVQYLIKDHIGSIHTVVPESGLLANSVGMSFTAFGERRNGTWLALPSSSSLIALNGISNNGFTGHPHSDALNVIHMGGRIYDPKLGRFLQADPFVQAPMNGQSLNRYTYAFNNPLSLTDPTGYFSVSRFFRKWGRVIIAAVASYFTYGAASGWASTWLGGTALAGSSVAISAIAGGIAGFVGGAILTGNLNGVVRGAFAGALFGGVSGFYGDNYSWQRVAVEGLSGGAGSEILGGDFEDGLVFALAVSSLTYANFKMRQSEREFSAQHPEGLNTNGESGGFFGDRTKIAGARRQVTDDGRMLACVSPAGGCQGAPTIFGDQRANLFGLDYGPNGALDFITESFAGPHDWFRNHVSRSYIRVPVNPYDVVGNMKNFSGWRMQVDRIANAVLIPVSVPFAVSASVLTLVPVYTTSAHYLFQP